MPSSLFGTYSLLVIIGGLAVIIVGQANVWQKSVPVWLVSGLCGIFVGAGIVVFAVHGQHNGLDAVPARPKRSQEEIRAFEVSQTNESAKGGMNARGGAGGVPGGSAATGGGATSARGGPAGGGPAGGGPGGVPRARRDLTILIGKLDLLTRSLQTRFDEESTARLSVALDALDKADEMTEEDATRHMDGLNRLLSEKTKEMLVLFDLPRVAAPSGGAAGGRPGATDGGRQDSSSSPDPAATGGAATGAARNGAGQAASNENPFKQEDNAKRLKLLRELIRPSGAELSP